MPRNLGVVSWWDSRLARVALCVTIACLLYLPRLGTPALWEPDEGRYGEIAREMAVSGDYVTPRDDWGRSFDKPPLVYWTTAAAIRLLGRNETAVRLPIALAAVAQIAITQILAETMFGPLAGACAALCLALSPIFLGFSRFLTVDPMLAMFVAAALASVYEALRKSGPRAGRKWLYLAATLAAFGTLTKGPVALVLIVATGVIFMLVEGRGRELAEVPWIACGFIVAAIDLPWFAAVSWRNPGFANFFIVHEHLQRYVVSTEHLWGPYFFAVVVAAGMWPWICFVPEAIREMVRPGQDNPDSVHEGNPGPALDVRAGVPAAGAESKRGGLRFALVWFAVVFLFFTIPRSKLGSYILPGIPPLAILAGYGVSRLPHLQSRRVSWIVGTIALVDLVVVLVATLAAPRIGELRAVPALRADLLIGTGGMAVGALAAFALARRAGVLAAVGLIALGMTIGLGAMVKAREDAAALNSYRELARAIGRELRPGCLMASYRHHVQALPFYTGWREALVGYRGELAPWGEGDDAARSFIATDEALRTLWSSGTCVILVVNRRDFAVLGARLAPPPRQIGAEGKKLAITNVPAGGSKTVGN
ncbi:MAG TPA: glycosyltransferase family 39 protein [Candidatus Binataceae bacterium]|nr:glycosyltransferase family 39 protein [Candidatus Binataceae bacterium]